MTLSLAELARCVAAGSVPLEYAVLGDEWLAAQWAAADPADLRAMVAACHGFEARMRAARAGWDAMHAVTAQRPCAHGEAVDANAAAIRALHPAPTLAALVAAAEKTR